MDMRGGDSKIGEKVREKNTREDSENFQESRTSIAVE